MKQIPITGRIYDPHTDKNGKKYNYRNGHIIEYTLIDDEDYDRCMEHSWTKNYKYLVTRINKKKLWLHQFILGKPPQGFCIHHKDENTLNNQKSNLELKSNSEHIRHHKINEKTKGCIPYRGISHHYNNYYRACITHKNKKIYLGSGKDPKALYEELYVPAYIKLHGHPPPQ